MRKLAPLLLAACGGSQTSVPPADSCAAPLAIQWGTPGDDEAFALIPARTPYGDSASAVAVGTDGGAFVAGANHGGTQPGIWVRRLDALGARARRSGTPRRPATSMGPR